MSSEFWLELQNDYDDYELIAIIRGYNSVVFIDFRALC